MLIDLNKQPTSPKRDQAYWMAAFASALPLAVLALKQTWDIFREKPTGLFGSEWGILLSGIFLFFVFLSLVLLVITWRRQTWLVNFLAWFDGNIHRTRMISILIALLLFTAFLLALWMRIPGTFLSSMWTRLALFWWVSLAGMLAVRTLAPRYSWLAAWSLATISALLIIQGIGILQWVTNGALAQGWSDGSLMYYSSLVVSERYYGMRLPLSFVYPTRALLDSIPLLAGSVPIWVHRLWGAILSLAIPSLAGYLLTRRLRIGDLIIRWATIGWVVTFLLQGGVKYELLVCVILVLAGADLRRPWLILGVLTLASFWAGMSRPNWYPVPAVLMILLYFLELPVSPRRGFVRYMILPVFWFFWGVGIALLGSLFCLYLTATDINSLFKFTVSQSFWYRLLPNPLFPPGILFGILVFSLPLFLIMAFTLRLPKKNGWNTLRVAGIGAILLVLFAGGLLVSSKIGGGGDLHNLDAYLVALLITAGWLAFGSYAPEPDVPPARSLPGWVLASLVVIQMGFVCYQLVPYRPDLGGIERAVNEMRPIITTASERGEVLFLRERPLLFFGPFEQVALVPEYDEVELAGMVYTGNYPPVGAFQDDLEAQRFSLIVASLQHDDIQDIYHHPFAEENNLWVRSVSQFLICYYEPVLILEDQNLALYVPIKDPICTH